MKGITNILLIGAVAVVLVIIFFSGQPANLADSVETKIGYNAAGMEGTSSRSFRCGEQPHAQHIFVITDGVENPSKTFTADSFIRIVVIQNNANPNIPVGTVVGNAEGSAINTFDICQEAVPTCGYIVTAPGSSLRSDDFCQTQYRLIPIITTIPTTTVPPGETTTTIIVVPEPPAQQNLLALVINEIADAIRQFLAFFGIAAQITGSQEIPVNVPATFTVDLTTTQVPDTDFSDGTVSKHFGTAFVTDDSIPPNLLFNTGTDEVAGQFIKTVDYTPTSTGRLVIGGVIVRTSNTYNFQTQEWIGWTDPQIIAQEQTLVVVTGPPQPPEPELDFTTIISNIVQSIRDFLCTIGLCI